MTLRHTTSSYGSQTSRENACTTTTRNVVALPRLVMHFLDNWGEGSSYGYLGQIGWASNTLYWNQAQATKVEA